MTPKTTIDLLLVEDNAGDVRLLREALKEISTPYIVLDVVSRLETAFDRVEQHTFDAILLDLSLPDSYGIETVERFLKTAPDIPIVILTGNNNETLALDAVQKGAQDYLVKGQTSGNTLLRAVRYAIERHQLVRKLAEAQQRALEAERRRVLAETAGATAHEINQPLTAILGHTDILIHNIDAEHPWHPELRCIIEACRRVESIIQKMTTVRHYETKHYLDGINIVDFEASAAKK